MLLLVSNQAQTLTAYSMLGLVEAARLTLHSGVALSCILACLGRQYKAGPAGRAASKLLRIIW